MIARERVGGNTSLTYGFATLKEGEFHSEGHDVFF